MKRREALRPRLKLLLDELMAVPALDSSKLSDLDSNMPTFMQNLGKALDNAGFDVVGDLMTIAGESIAHFVHALRGHHNIGESKQHNVLKMTKLQPQGDTDLMTVIFGEHSHIADLEASLTR